MRLDWKPFPIHLDSFRKFLRDNIGNSDGINASEESFEIVEVQPLSQEEIDLIMAYYDGMTQQAEAIKFQPTIEQIIDIKIESSLKFGTQILSDFVKENVLLGITQRGLTNHVRRTLFQVKDAIESGSLYDAITEIKNLPESAFDSVILTPQRMLHFRNRIEIFVKVPIASSWNQTETWL